MADDTTPTFGAADYDAIEAALAETARGRWFLGEFARRQRAAETETLLAAIGRLETAMVADQRQHSIEALRADIAEMTRAFSQPPRPPAAAPVDEAAPTPTAPEILFESGAENPVPTEPEPPPREPPAAEAAAATELEPAPLVAPASSPDALLSEGAPPPEPAAEDPAPRRPRPLDPEALAGIDALTTREKLRRFT